MTRKVVDIECNTLLANMLDFSQLPYRLKPDSKLWCVVVRDIDTKEVTTLSSCFGNTITKTQVEKAFEGCTEVIAHNGIKFDFITMKLFGVLDYSIGWLGEEDTLFGKPVKFTDTLIRSRLFNPDRFGGHGLKAWGERIGNFKDDFRAQCIEAGIIEKSAPKAAEFQVFSELMLKYCQQDTAVTEAVHLKLEQEFIDYPRWKQPEKMENKLADIGIRRESYGFWFNRELALWALDDLQTKMKNLADIVNPHLPPKRMNKGTLKEYTPPKIQLKMDGTASAHMMKFAKKHGAEIDGDLFIYKGFARQMPFEEPIETEEVASIDDLDHVKMQLINLGWRPLEFKIRDLSKNSKKQSIPLEKQLESMNKWLDQTFDEGKYTESRLDELNLGTDKAVVKFALEKKLKAGKPCKVPTAPSVRTGVEKNLCENLVKLGDKVSFAKDFALYLTYRHRKSSIAGGDIEDMDFDEETPNTGFLAMYRPEDGRVATPAIEIGASTNRYRHIGVCNIPRASSEYGDYMRSMFGCGEGMVQLGQDASSLEACIQGHYILPFGGEELAKQLLAKKPNDIHCYSEDTEILTQNGWKLFGNLTEFDKVAQYDEGLISFVKPLDIVWQEYEGDMYTDPTTNFKVTPNHRVLFKRYTSGANAIVRADEFKPSSDKRYIVGGSKIGGSLNLSDAFIKLLVATQADGCLAKDCSAIQFSFVKDDKIARLEGILLELGEKYSKSTHFRKGRDETSIRISSGSLTVQVRNYLSECKSFKDELLNLPYNKLKILINEVKYWDGTERSNGDVVLDTTDKTACEFIQTVASLVGYKTNFNSYVKNTSFGVVSVYRVYISTNTLAVKSANKPLEVSHYKGFIGCVSVPSGLVLVKRKGEIVVSGNTLNAIKLFGTADMRDPAKSMSYALMYGAAYMKLKAMLGVSDSEALRIFNEYWDAVMPLKMLKEALTESWKNRGKTFIIGVDGRKIMTRSAHSLLNALFQSGGVICMKYVAIFLMESLEKQGLRWDVFKDSELDVAPMIEYHDEQQLAVNPKLISYKVFDNKELAKEFVKDWKGEQLGAIIEGKNDKAVIAMPNVVSKALIDSYARSVETVNLNVKLSCEWVVHKNWYGCH